MATTRKQNCETFKASEEFAMDVCISIRAAAARTSLTGGQAVSDFMHRSVNFQSLDREKFWLIAVDSKLRPLALIELFSGGVSSSMVDVALTIRRLVSVPLAIGGFFVHNHPSGQATPSAEDSRLALMLDEACMAVGMRAVDHLIMTRDPKAWYSATEGRSS